jgi:NAD(P)-dependent dehydrogenase (short-subunit alcohol dehydrogenase family)
MKLQDRVAIVTGCGRERGIGRATVMRLAMEGAHIVACEYGRTMKDYPEAKFGQMDELDSVVAEVHKLGRRCLPVKVDVTDEAEVIAMAEAAWKEFGRIDILFNNVGGGIGGGPVIQQTLDSWNKTIAINLTGTFLCSKHVAPKMIQGGRGGRIINTSSMVGKRGSGGAAAYSTGKHAVIGFTRSLAYELAPNGITVNAVCPGFVDTQMFEMALRMVGAAEKLDREGAKKYFERQVPLGRMETGDDVANVVAFLASDDANYMTGQSISIDGGVEWH